MTTASANISKNLRTMADGYRANAKLRTGNDFGGQRGVIGAYLTVLCDYIDGNRTTSTDALAKLINTSAGVGDVHGTFLLQNAPFGAHLIQRLDDVDQHDLRMEIVRIASALAYFDGHHDMQSLASSVDYYAGVCRAFGVEPMPVCVSDHHGAPHWVAHDNGVTSGAAEIISYAAPVVASQRQEL